MKHLLLALTQLLCLPAFCADLNINVTVTSDSAQQVTGFGAAAMGTLMCPITDASIIEKAYGPDSPVGLNILRMEVSANTVGDITSEWYDSPYDWKGYVNAVKMARSKGAVIMATPWSPPAIYKTNNSASGGKNEEDPTQSQEGKLNATGYRNFFSWLNTFVTYMKNQDAPVDVVAIQNEPDWWVGYNGCLYTPQEMHDLVAQYAKRFSKASGVRLMGGESFYFNPEYTDKLLDDEATRDYIDLIGGHIYGSAPLGNMKTACEKATKYGKETWMTEHTVHPLAEGRGVYDLPDWHDELIYAEELNESMLAGISGYVYWYLYQRWGMVGDGEAVPSGGNVKGRILPRGYVTSHFAKHLPGAWRVNTTSSNYSSQTGAFERSAYMKGDSIIVIAIDTVARNINLQLTLPCKVRSCKVISSTSQESLCKETAVDIPEPTDFVTVPISGRSVNTIIFDRAVPTPVRAVRPVADKGGDKNAVYNLQGQRLNARPRHGIGIVGGKKVVW